MPVIPDTREQMADPGSAYQIVTMMQGVVRARHRPKWCKRSASRSPARREPPATGAMRGSSASRPTSPPASISAIDDPDSLGDDETGGHVAAPVFRDFMIAALKDAPATPFRIAARDAAVSRQRGDRPAGGAGEPAIYEAYKPGTEPGQNRNLGLQRAQGEEDETPLASPATMAGSRSPSRAAGAGGSGQRDRRPILGARDS